MTSIDEMVKDLPEDQRVSMRQAARVWTEQRKHYGFAVPEGTWPEPLTMAEMREGEGRNHQAILEATLRKHGGKRDLSDWLPTWHSKVTHNRDLPSFAVQTILANCWDEETERELAQCAWTQPEWPMVGVTRDAWLKAFYSVGFICTFDPCDLHGNEWDQEGTGENIVAWRGSFKAFQRGMSWTTDRDRAAWFVKRGDMSGKGRRMHLWRTEIPNENVAAHFNNRTEHEVVADVRRLRITEERP